MWVGTTNIVCTHAMDMDPNVYSHLGSFVIEMKWVEGGNIQLLYALEY